MEKYPPHRVGFDRGRLDGTFDTPERNIYFYDRGAQAMKTTGDVVADILIRATMRTPMKTEDIAKLNIPVCPRCGAKLRDSECVECLRRAAAALSKDRDLWMRRDK